MTSILVLCSTACTNETLPKDYPPASALYDSKRCAACHPKHYDEWSASMHAYAAEDPVFLAMNQRGQEDTRGELGILCVNCHAPLAVRLGFTDGKDLSGVPVELRGVTCYFCHNTDGVGGTHNNPLELSDDVTMRAGIKKPADTAFHRSSYSELLSGERAESSAMCGSCHDIVLPTPPAPAAVPLERTYSEWLTSVFSPEHAPAPEAVRSCTSCHLPVAESDEPIAPSGPKRARHSHHMAGVDGPLTPFPNSGDATHDAELAAEQAAQRQTLLDPTVRVEICLQRWSETEFAFHVTLDNANAGHNFPSGASQDRRAWVEVIAYEAGEAIYESGVFAEGEPATTENDPDLWLLRDKTFDEAGNETHMFWDVADHDDKTLPVQLTTNPADANYYKTHLQRRFPFDEAATLQGNPDRITARLRIMPIGLEVLDDLIGTGHLLPGFRDAMQTLDLLPSRNESFRAESGLAGLNVVTMEWSTASQSSKLFVARTDFTRHPEWSCVGMPRKPSR